MDAAAYSEPRRRMFRLPDGEMAALEFGDESRPIDVVFLHANGFNALTYRSILAPLASTLRVLAVDQRGHGASRLPADPHRLLSWKVYRDDLLAVLAEIGGPAPVLAGHSMGGTVSILTAGRNPAVARGVVLFDPVIMPKLAALGARMPWAVKKVGKRIPIAEAAARRRPGFESAEAAFAAYRGRGAFKTWTETQLADYVAGGFRPDPEGGVTLSCTREWEAASFAAQANDPWRALSRIGCPITVFRAEHHSTCRVGVGDSLIRANRRLTLTTVPGTSHFLPMERPGLVRDALLDAAL